jgi:hypothetical protein
MISDLLDGRSEQNPFENVEVFGHHMSIMKRPQIIYGPKSVNMIRPWNGWRFARMV